MPNRVRAVLNGRGDPLPRVAGRSTPIAVGDAIASCVPVPSLSRIDPPSTGDLDAGHGPDCRNHEVGAERALRRARRDRSSTAISAQLSTRATVGLGAHGLTSDAGAEQRRTSEGLEHEGGPRTWTDRIPMERRHLGAAGDPCDASLERPSSGHPAEGVGRLEGVNGALDGAARGCRGRRRLDAPGGSVMDGRHQAKPEDGETMLRPSALRVIHKPCRGKPGARFTIAMEHDHQKRSADNARILQALVNGVGLNGIRRMLSPAGAKSSCGMSRVHDRIFWLERTLLAFEREQLRRWRERAAREGETVRHHLAHDDIVLSVNGETRDDRRISQINCSTTADVRSGYVFRLDVDFDPTVDPATLFDRTFVDPDRGLVNVRREHEGASGEPYTAPLMSFQRPTGRFDEHHFFAAAVSQVALFRSRDLPRMPTDTPEQQRERAEVDAESAARLALIRTLHHGYFDLPESTDDRRAPHTGIMTRDILTKSAHFEMLRRTLPPGWWTLVSPILMPGVVLGVASMAIRRDAFGIDAGSSRPPWRHRASWPPPRAALAPGPEPEGGRGRPRHRVAPRLPAHHAASPARTIGAAAAIECLRSVERDPATFSIGPEHTLVTEIASRMRLGVSPVIDAIGVPLMLVTLAAALAWSAPCMGIALRGLPVGVHMPERLRRAPWHDPHRSTLELTNALNRPGFPGGPETWKDGAHGRREDEGAARRAGGSPDLIGGRGEPAQGVILRKASAPLARAALDRPLRR